MSKGRKLEIPQASVPLLLLLCFLLPVSSMGSSSCIIFPIRLLLLLSIPTLSVWVRGPAQVFSWPLGVPSCPLSPPTLGHITHCCQEIFLSSPLNHSSTLIPNFLTQEGAKAPPRSHLDKSLQPYFPPRHP